MGEDTQGKTITRRNALKVLAGAASVAARGPLPPLRAAEAEHCAAAAVRPAAVLASAAETRPAFLSAHQMRALTALCEAIIPADEDSPGATAAGVPAYIDTILLDSAEERKKLWTEGLAAMDRLAEKEFTRRFADCTGNEQEQLLLKISAGEEDPTTDEEKFFVAVKGLAIDGYYNSEVGLHQDLEFQGNTMLADFEGCTHPEHGAPEPGKA